MNSFYFDSECAVLAAFDGAHQQQQQQDACQTAMILPMGMTSMNAEVLLASLSFDAEPIFPSSMASPSIGLDYSSNYTTPSSASMLLSSPIPASPMISEWSSSTLSPALTATDSSVLATMHSTIMTPQPLFLDTHAFIQNMNLMMFSSSDLDCSSNSSEAVDEMDAQSIKKEPSTAATTATATPSSSSPATPPSPPSSPTTTPTATTTKAAKKTSSSSGSKSAEKTTRRGRPPVILNRTFSCSHCGMEFSRKHDCLRHEATRHALKGSKTHRCARCGIWFTRSDSLRKHERMRVDCAAASIAAAPAS